MVDMVPVKSSHIAAWGYDPATQELFIQFPESRHIPSRRYKYKGVPPEVHAEFVAADSLGSYFYHKIRGGGYEFERLEDT